MEPRVRDAFAAIDRRSFLPGPQRRFADQDRPLGIGFGQTNSQPTTVVNMLTLLDVQPGQRVLDVGSGSGWTTALLGHLVGPEGEVLGVELVAELARSGARNLSAYDMEWTSIRPAEPGVYGLPELAPFDRILVSAMADELPLELVDQLRPGGLMVIPVRSRMLVVRSRGEDPPEVTEHGRYAFVPLVAGDPDR
ncbi:MAG: protein-L-isoaspartate carboxylmethyltransferase [Acidimicrobiales bacterium]|nr:protein-L-isoaspartate carboxylmethyltransferase [Acidimicrobiales bacterium]